MYQRKSVRCLGVDPGIANTGIAIVESRPSGYTLKYHATLRTSKKDTEANRFRSLQWQLANVIDEHNPALVAIERVFFNKNITSNQTTAGVIAIALCEAEKANLTSYLLTPQEIKMASGIGRTATKLLMAKMASRLFGVEFTPRQNHAVDAAFAAVCGILKHRSGCIRDCQSLPSKTGKCGIISAESN